MSRRLLRLPRLRVRPPGDWLEGARRLESPNRDARPSGVRPELIVVHGISLPPGYLGGPYIEALFTNTLDPELHPAFRSLRDLRVSSHLLIRRTGELVQFVPFSERAWHAGVSRFRGRSRCNDFSIGIELEGQDLLPYTAVQYERLCATIRALRRGIPSLVRAPVVGHSDIAPGRKTDPGPAFDWCRLDGLVGGPRRRRAVTGRSPRTGSGRPFLPRRS